MNRSSLPALLVVALAAATGAIACTAETGPGAPERQNGCIDLGCKVEPTPIPIDNGDGGTPDGG